MELMIRSQNRLDFKKYNDCLSIVEIENGKYIIDDIDGSKEYAIFEEDIELGRFETLERALEVLDEIQGLFIKQKSRIIMSKDGLKVINSQPNSIVYEMPKE